MIVKKYLCVFYAKFSHWLMVIYLISNTLFTLSRPETKFSELIDHSEDGENQPKKKILQRKPNSLDEKQVN